MNFLLMKFSSLCAALIVLGLSEEECWVTGFSSLRNNDIILQIFNKSGPILEFPLKIYSKPSVTFSYSLRFSGPNNDIEDYIIFVNTSLKGQKANYVTKHYTDANYTKDSFNKPINDLFCTANMYEESTFSKRIWFWNKELGKKRQNLII